MGDIYRWMGFGLVLLIIKVTNSRRIKDWLGKVMFRALVILFALALVMEACRIGAELMARAYPVMINRAVVDSARSNWQFLQVGFVAD